MPEILTYSSILAFLNLISSFLSLKIKGPKLKLSIKNRFIRLKEIKDIKELLCEVHINRYSFNKL